MSTITAIYESVDMRYLSILVVSLNVAIILSKSWFDTKVLPTIEDRDVEIAVIGSLMTELPLPGETIMGTSFEHNFGGKGANQAVQCARLGINVAMCGMLGNDDYGKQYLDTLANERVITSHMMTSRNNLSTGIAAINVGALDGNNCITIIPGANLEYNPGHVNELDHMIRSCCVIICQNEIALETTRRALELASMHNTISIFNPAPVSTESLSELKSLIGLCDIICPNEVELSLLTAMPSSTDKEVMKAATKLLEQGCKAVIVTLGGRGAYVVSSKGKSQFFVAEKVDVVDTVGAGDSFIGTLASNIARGGSLHTAVKRALHCASISVTRKGAQKSFAKLLELHVDMRPQSQLAAKRSIQELLDGCS